MRAFPVMIRNEAVPQAGSSEARGNTADSLEYGTHVYVYLLVMSELAWDLNILCP